MISPKFFPFILVVLDICAVAIYAAQGDWRRVVYWLAAFCLTLSVIV